MARPRRHGRVRLATTSSRGRDRQINLSGGTLNVEGGKINQSYLQGADGRLYEVSRALGDILYTGIYKGYEDKHARWGDNATRYFYNPLIAPKQRYEDGYTVGRDAGSLIIGTKSAVLEGDIVADVFTGNRQFEAPRPSLDGYYQSQTATARRGQLIVGQYTPKFDPQAATYDLLPLVDQVVFQGDYQPVADSIGLKDDLPEERASTLYLDAPGLNGFGLGGLLVAAVNAIDVESELSVSPGGTIDLYGPAVKVDADLAAPSGHVLLGNIRSGHVLAPADTSVKVGVTVGDGVTIDTRGLWTDLTANPGLAANLAYVDGGEVRIESTADVMLGQGSLIDVSSGAALRLDHSIVGGRGGSITLAAGENSQDTTPAKIVLGGTLRGYGVSSGGTLDIETGTSVGIGGDILRQDGILQGGERAATSLTALEDFIVPAGEALPADYTIVKNFALPGEVIGGAPQFSVDHPYVLPVDWTPPPASQMNTSYFLVASNGVEYREFWFEGDGAQNTVPAGTVIVAIRNAEVFPVNYVVPNNGIFPNGIPIVPSNVRLAAGTVAPVDASFKAGSVIQAGMTVPGNVRVRQPLIADTSLFQSGFSNYVVNGAQGVVVADGAHLSVTIPVFNVSSNVVADAAAGRMDPAATLWTPPLYQEDPFSRQLTQREGADIVLRANAGLVGMGNIDVGPGSSIQVDPGHSISLLANQQISVDGRLIAHGGSVTIGPAAEVFEPNVQPYDVTPTQSVYLGPRSLIDVSGTSVTAGDTRGHRYGLMKNGGTVDIAGSPGMFILMEPGARIDASGASMEIDTPTSRRGEYASTFVAGDGGTIGFASHAGIYLDGTITAASGGAGGMGGTLGLTLETSLYQASSAVPDSMRKPAELVITQRAADPDVPQGANADPSLLQYGYARIGVDQIEAGGFDNVSLFARDLITFDGDVALATDQSIRLLQGAIGNTSPDASVTLRAPYVLLSGRTDSRRQRMCHPSAPHSMPGPHRNRIRPRALSWMPI